MIIANEVFSNMINSPVRKIRGRVEIYEGSTLTLLCGCQDNLISFTIDRVGEEGKFFGYGICQKLNAHLLDKERSISVSTANTLEVEYGVDNNFIYPHPNFYVTEVNRDENTNELSITAYDALYKATNYKVSDLNLIAPYTIGDVAAACATLLGIPIGELDTSFDTVYETGANFDGNETVRDALNAIAEATQTIYYIDKDWNLIFKKLDSNAAAALTIGKASYIELDSKTNRRLSAICSATELGDNVIASLDTTGTTQYVRDNPFWDLRDDIADLVDAALVNIGGLTINQFECSWRGNFLLEIGDKIDLITKDDKVATSYVLNDSISYDGTLSQNTSWSYADNDNESLDNPTSLGEVIKQTYAKVDKANKTIEMTVDEVTNLSLTTENISASVIDLNDRVNATMTSEQIAIEIEDKIAEGITEVTTTTGFTFNSNGLEISKTDSEISTTITEDGMKINKNDKEVLTANNQGVKAIDLHAKTYLIIGNNSRIEDYGDDRSGCFWIRD